jgi:hypothetical protein
MDMDMKKLQKLFLMMPFVALSVAYAMEKTSELGNKLSKENQERLQSVNNYNAILKTYKKDGLLKFAQAVQNAKKLHDTYGAAKRRENIAFPMSPHDKHVYVRLNFNDKGQLIGDAVLMHHVVEAGRTISSVARKDDGLILFHSESDGYVYGKMDRVDYEKCHQDLEKIKALVKQEMLKSGIDSDISLDKEKMAQEIAKLSKRNDELEYSLKNGHTNGNSNGNVNKQTDYLELVAKNKELSEELKQKKMISNEESKMEVQLKENNESYKKIITHQNNVLSNACNESKTRQSMEIDRLSGLLLNGARELDNLESQLKVEKSSWFNRKTMTSAFVGGAITLASYTGLKAAYNWYFNKA